MGVPAFDVWQEVQAIENGYEARIEQLSSDLHHT